MLLFRERGRLTVDLAGMRKKGQGFCQGETMGADHIVHSLWKKNPSMRKKVAGKRQKIIAADIKQKRGDRILLRAADEPHYRGEDSKRFRRYCLGTKEVKDLACQKERVMGTLQTEAPRKKTLRVGGVFPT